MIGGNRLQREFNAEETIEQLISNNQYAFEIFINRKFYRCAIIQSKKFTDSVLKSNNENIFMYNGKVFYVIDDGKDLPRIWSAYPTMLYSRF